MFITNLLEFMYLQRRYRFVAKTIDVALKKYLVNLVVPQGANLGYLLFLLFINDNYKL